MSSPWQGSSRTSRRRRLDHGAGRAAPCAARRSERWGKASGRRARGCRAGSIQSRGRRLLGLARVGRAVEAAGVEEAGERRHLDGGHGRRVWRRCSSGDMSPSRRLDARGCCHSAAAPAARTAGRRVAHRPGGGLTGDQAEHGELLPEPLGPQSAQCSPARIDQFRFFKTGLPP